MRDPFDSSNQKFYGPRLNVALKVDCLMLGSEYGGWMLADLPSLHSGTVLSCGLGEDASFDVEVARRFGATLIMVDPTAVSDSVVNFQDGYSKTTPFIEVPSIDFVFMANEYQLDVIALAGFDIDGAEIMVIPQMLEVGIRPEQVLGELDNLNWPLRRARENFDCVHGRFRVACALAIVTHQLAIDWMLLFDDYEYRPHHRVVKEYAELTEMCGRMAVFTPKANVDAARWALAIYARDWRQGVLVMRATCMVI